MNDGVYQKLKLVYQKPEIRVPTEIILSVFASLFLVVAAIRPTLVMVTELRKKIEDQTLVETKLDTKIRSLIQARKQLDENEGSLPLFERAVPESFTYADLAKKIEIVAIEEEVKIESLVFSSVIVSDDENKDSGVKTNKNEKGREWTNGENKVKEFTIGFSIVASESSMVNFIKKIENLDRVLVVSMVEITKTKKRESLQNRIRASGKINGYYLVTTENQ